MNVEQLIVIALAFFVLLSIAAGGAALYLLKIAKDRSYAGNKQEQLAKPIEQAPKVGAKSRANEADGEPVADSDNLGVSEDPIGYDALVARYGSKILVIQSHGKEFIEVNPHVEGIGGQVASINQLWSSGHAHWKSSSGWQKAIDMKGTDYDFRTAQKTFGFGFDFPDYMQRIGTARPEALENLIRNASRHRRLA